MKKKRLKIIAVVVGVLTILLTIAAAIFFLPFYQALREMSPLATGSYLDGVLAVKDGYVNMYLVPVEEGYIAIDAGRSAGGVKRQLGKLKIDPQKVRGVFLTHTDFDHTGAVSLFPKAQIFIGQGGVQMLTGTVKRASLFSNKQKFSYSVIANGGSLYYGQTSITCLYTAGHTPCSVAYLVNGKWLFTGDTLALKGGKVTIFTEKFNMEPIRQMESIRALKYQQGVKAIFTGHHGLSADPAAAFSDVH